MNAKALARKYVNLTAEERFRLIVAASARGDMVQRDRLINAGERRVLNSQDHVPYSRAFDELSLLIFIELQDEAARYLEWFARADHVNDRFGDDEEEDGDGVEEEGEDGDGVEEGGESVEKEASEAKGDAEVVEQGASERPIFQRYLNLALATGFALRTKAEGWKLFCKRMTIPPFALWEYLPGFDRLQRALDLSENAAFEAGGLLRWLNAIRPAGEPARLKVPLTVEGVADGTEELFRERVEWWGG